jgi:hypothetical protein
VEYHPQPHPGVAQHLNKVFAIPASRIVWAVGAFSNFGDDPEFGLLEVPQTFALVTSQG